MQSKIKLRQYEEEVVQFESRATAFRNANLDKNQGGGKQEGIELGRMLGGLT